MSGSGEGADLVITRGACVVMFAFDAGFSVDLDKAERRVAALADADGRRESIRHRRRAPRHFEYRPLPLTVTRHAAPLRIAGRDFGAHVELTVYDFGAVSVAYRAELSGPIGGLLELTDALYEHEGLLRAAREQAMGLVERLGDAVRSPHVRDTAEDYLVLHVGEAVLPPGFATAGEWVEGHKHAVARMLRSEREALSETEIAEALSARLSYGLHDATVVDWNAALVFDADASDTLAVLEFANVELLQLRALDDMLDRALDEAYEAVAKPRGPLAVWRGGPARLRRIARLQMDSAVLFEGMNNALKLLGDQYLARMYRLASVRLHLPEWDATVLRKLATLDSVYQKMADRQASIRIEILEWIIIFLIAFEVVWSFFR